MISFKIKCQRKTGTFYSKTSTIHDMLYMTFPHAQPNLEPNICVYGGITVYTVKVQTSNDPNMDNLQALIVQFFFQSS